MSEIGQSPTTKKRRMDSDPQYSNVYVPSTSNYKRTSDQDCFVMYEGLACKFAYDLKVNRIQVVVTESMKSLYTTVTSSKSLTILLTGPKGRGKSTVLYWLYWQFVNIKEYDVYAVPLSIDAINDVYTSLKTSDKRILLVSDFNTIQNFDSNILIGLYKCASLVRMKKGVSIFAASSALLGTARICDRKVRSSLQKMIDICNIHPIETDKSAALRLVEQISPIGSNHDELLEKAMHNILCILLSITSLEGMEKKMIESWQDLDEIIVSDQYASERSSNRKLLLALWHRLPITVFDVSECEARNLIPLLWHVVCLGEKQIPFLMLPIPQFVIKRSISALSKTLPETDEASAVGFVFERVSLSYVGGKSYKVAWEVGEPEDITMPELTFSGSRFNPETMDNAGCNLLWQFEQFKKAVDAFACTTDALVLFQISIQKKNQVDKVNKFGSLPSSVIEMAGRYKKVVCVYVNPMTSLDDFSNLRNKFFTAVKYQEHKRKFCFAMPVDQEIFIGILQEIKVTLAPK